jgi:hypothetical protein
MGSPAAAVKGKAAPPRYRPPPALPPAVRLEVLRVEPAGRGEVLVDLGMPGTAGPVLSSLQVHRDDWPIRAWPPLAGEVLGVVPARILTVEGPRRRGNEIGNGSEVI